MATASQNAKAWFSRREGNLRMLTDEMMMNVFWMFLILDAWFRYISCAILLQFSFIATMSLQKGNLDWFDKWDLGKITAAHRAEHFLSLSLNFEVIWHSQSFAFCAVCSCSAMTCRASELQKLNHKRSPAPRTADRQAFKEGNMEEFFRGREVVEEASTHCAILCTEQCWACQTGSVILHHFDSVKKFA